jgi:hypothetical protein
MLRCLIFLVAILAAPAAFAQCNPNVPGGVPFNCAPGANPGPSDLFLGGSRTGNTNGFTVAFTGQQLVGMDHSLSPVTAAAGPTKTLALWMAQLQSLGSTPIVIGGQSVYLGGATQNLGNGPMIALATGTFVAGHCRQTDAFGNEVDSGAACGGGGGGGGTGSGTVTSGTANQLAYYATTGTTVAGLATTNNSVLIAGATGAPAFATTLPSNVTLPNPTISTGNLTGTTSAVNINTTGRVSLAASSTTQAGLNLGQGIAPTTPANGDMWLTTSGVFARVAGATVQLTGGTTTGLTSVTASAPLAGAGTSGSPLTCTTCVTSTAGGALAVTAPLQLSGSALSLGTQPGAALVQWPSNTTVTADTYYYSLSWPWATGTITGVTYLTGGTTPSFSIAVQINGASVTGCSGLTVTSSTAATATCTAANTITRGQKVVLGVSAVSGTPQAAAVQITYNRSAN